MTKSWLVNFLRDRSTQTAKTVQLHTYWGLVLEFTMVVNPKASLTLQLNGAFPYLLTWLTLFSFYAVCRWQWSPLKPNYSLSLFFKEYLREDFWTCYIARGKNARNHLYKCLPKIIASFITVTYEHLWCARHSAKCKVIHNPHRTLWCKHYSLSWSYRWGIGLK